MSRSLLLPGTPVRRMAAVTCAAALALTSAVALGLPASADPTPAVAGSDAPLPDDSLVADARSGGSEEPGTEAPGEAETSEAQDAAQMPDEPADTGAQDAPTPADGAGEQPATGVRAATELDVLEDAETLDDEPAAGAEAHVVTNLADAGPGSLRAALELADATPGPDVITFDPSLSGDLVLDSGILVASSVRIEGPGADVLRIVPTSGIGSRGEAFVGFGAADQADAADIVLTGLTLGIAETSSVISNQSASGDPLYVGSLTLDQVVFSTTYVSLSSGLGAVDVVGVSLQEAQLVMSSVSGDVRASGSTFTGNSMFSVVEVGGDVALSGINASAEGPAYGHLNLYGISGAVTIVDSVFSGNVGMLNISQVDGPTTISGVEMRDEAGNLAGGFNIYGVGGAVTISDTVVRGRYSPLQISAYDDAQAPIPVVLRDVTVEGVAESWSTAVTVSGGGIGSVDISGLVVDRQTVAVSVFSVRGPVTITDSTLSGGDLTSTTAAVMLSGVSGGLTVERTTIERFQTGLYVSAGDGAAPLVLRDSLLRDLDGPAMFVQSPQDALVDSVHLLRTEGAVYYTAPEDRTLTVRGSTFEDVVPGEAWGMVAPIVVTDSRLDISASTFYQGAGDLGAMTHFIQLDRQGIEAADEVASITASTFSGLGVLRSSHLDDADTVVVSHVLGDSADEAGQVADDRVDLLIEQGGRLVVDHSVFSAAQEQLVGGAAEAVWGRGVQTQVSAQDKRLGALADNGGPTPTMLLLAGSVALDAGDPAVVGVGLGDQRGLPRVYRTVDVGAVEMNYGVLSLSGPATVTAGEPAELVVSRVHGYDGAEGPASVDLVLVPGTAEHGVDYTGLETQPVVLTAGVDAVTVTVPTFAVQDREDRTLAARLSADLTQTPTLDPAVLDLRIIHPPTAGPTDPTDPTDPTNPTDPEAGTGQMQTPTAPVQDIAPGTAPDAAAQTAVGGSGARLARTGADVGMLLALAGVVLMAGSAGAAVRRSQRG